MITYERPQATELTRLLGDDLPPRIVAVTGPRQCGKTTLVRQALTRVRATGLEGALVPVDDPGALQDLSPIERGRLFGSEDGIVLHPGLRDTRWLQGVWEWGREKAWDAAARGRPGFVLALDEIQDVPEWSRTVKGLWDQDRHRECPLKVVILGSAPWQLLTGRSESLAGRFVPLDLRHWSLVEMADAFDFTLDEYLYFGGYPGAAEFIDDLGLWRSYVSSSILAPVFQRDNLAMTRVDKPSLMRQLVDLSMEYSGQIVGYDTLAGAGHVETVRSYLDLLSDAGIVGQLPKHSGSAARRAQSSRKLNALNTGLMTALSGYSFDEARTDRTFWGRVFESAVGAHLHNTLDASMRLSYWRDGKRRDGKREVDFVVSRGKHVLGIEVKSRRKARWVPALPVFEKRFKKARTLLVVGAEQGGTRSPGATGRGRAVPVNEFLAQSAPHWLNWSFEEES